MTTMQTNSFGDSRYCYDPEIHASSHMQEILGPGKLKRVVSNLCTAIKQSNIDYDSIAVAGASGCLIGGVLSQILDKPLFVIHQSRTSVTPAGAQGYYANRKYIIVDDLVFTGKTVRNIESYMTKQFPESSPVGIFLYLEDQRPLMQVDLGQYTLKPIGTFSPANASAAVLV